MPRTCQLFDKRGQPVAPRMRRSLQMNSAASTSKRGVTLLVQLNDARKSEAYGDVVKPDLDPADLVTDIEEYVTAVEALLAK